MSTKSKNTPQKPAPKTRGAAPSAVLDDEDRAKIKAIEGTVGQAKVAYADAVLQLNEAKTKGEEQVAAKRTEVEKASKEYIDAVVAIAGKHGININDPKRRWNFDTAAYTFTQVKA